MILAEFEHKVDVNVVELLIKHRVDESVIKVLELTKKQSADQIAFER